MTCGATDGFSKAVEAFTNPWDAKSGWISERQGILCEEFTYMNAIQTVKPRGVNIVPIAVDSEGMKASGKGGLADVLKNWDYARGRRPHLMYTVTYAYPPNVQSAM
jgi:DNA-binding transcriptional MocR family regulator